MYTMLKILISSFMHVAFSFVLHYFRSSVPCAYLVHKSQVTGGLQLQPSWVCSTLHFNVPPKVAVCGPGTLGIYFERTVDTSFNVIYLVDDQLWMTWHTNNFTNAAGKYTKLKLKGLPLPGSSDYLKKKLNVTTLVNKNILY